MNNNWRDDFKAEIVQREHEVRALIDEHKNILEEAGFGDYYITTSVICEGDLEKEEWKKAAWDSVNRVSDDGLIFAHGIHFSIPETLFFENEESKVYVFCGNVGTAMQVPYGDIICIKVAEDVKLVIKAIVDICAM